MKKIILSVATIAAFHSASTAQDIHFSQFYEAAILRNPALAGVFSADYKIGALYRNQWSSISAPYQTGMLSGEVRIPMHRDFITAGLIAYYDKAGSTSFQSMSVCPAINYHKLLNEETNTFLSVGFMGGYVQRSFDPAKMTFDEQYQNSYFSSDNPNGESLPNPKLSQWDLGAGIGINSAVGDDNNVTYVVGVSVAHLTRPRSTFFSDNEALSQPMRFGAQASLGARLNEIWRVQGHINYQHSGREDEIMIGGLLSWNKMDERELHTLFSLHGGIFYRYGDALVPVLKLDIHDVTVAMSYDLNVSTLRAGTNMRGGYEISLFKTGLFNGKLENPRTACPMIF